ncbi:Z1 domain-containing protein [Streptomyces sp. NPDC060194]|uniref:Z1 domain-containing protein n=1 Tax=Streptomyces sp. NPDC060194 TaxID=3347069 RepID=UPI00365A01A0
MTDYLLDIHTTALAPMESGPRHFAKWAALAADEDYPDADLGEDTFAAVLAADAAASGPLTAIWSKALTSWDFAESPSWSPDTAPRTPERRAAAYGRLAFGDTARKALDAAVPVLTAPAPTVISRDDFTPWYTPQRAAARSFYWKSYAGKLRSNGWSDTAVAGLDESCRTVVERLTDPEQQAAKQSKGLVVGYVQSGKTANFTGVAAKALDAGYRLVIVLGGTLNLLRSQTQRRLDMELVGQENILRGADPADPDTLVDIDYIGDDGDWDDFVRHGGRPRDIGGFDIERLTGRSTDYTGLAGGISALEGHKHDPSQPLYDAANLHRSAARLMVVKKNKAVLTKLVKDLKQVRGILGELPVLIIDDESDQASVNTSNPKKWSQGRTERTAINNLISQLLGLLPRAQYVGYTATPFANVFVDPGDGGDIFPSDFLISLPRPDGYMGVQDFHDIDSPVPFSERTIADSQQKAHVRDVYEDDAEDMLQEAMDSFLLTGALKRYRIDRGVPEKKFRHHTMLVHESVRKEDHAELAERITAMWHRAGYSSTAGHERLAALWAKDFARVSAVRAPDLPSPAAYDELKPYVYQARSLAMKGGSPVIVVNGDSDRYFDQLDLDFDRTPNVWKILVGGTKLSRGFTVEGLTVTYYRRTTLQADTLMQMGRWFGFRPGYQDLVRLYIARGEKDGTGAEAADLYEAFEAICRDEESFRQQLAQYAELVDGRPQVVPSQVPPLVMQHLDWVPPTARNKRFNAELVEIRSPGRPVEPAVYPRSRDALRRNTGRWLPLLRRFGTEPAPFDTASGRQFTARTAVVSHSELLSVLTALEWEQPGKFAPHLRYLANLDGTLAKVDDWVLITPQLSDRNRVEAHFPGAQGTFSLVRRSRQQGKDSFGRIAGVEHREAAQALVDNAAAPGRASASAVEVGPRTGVVLLYPVVEASTSDAVRAAVSADGSVDSSKVVMAFTLFAPKSAADSTRRLVRFQAKDSRHQDAVVVDVE